MNYTHNRERILRALKEGPGGSVVATEPVRILFPARFRDIQLAVLGEHTFVYGLFAVIIGQEYALFNINAYVEMGKGKNSLETVEEQDYVSIAYEAGDTFIRTQEIVARSALIFKAIDEFFFKGKLPFYVRYEDAGELFDTAQTYAGTKAKLSPPVVEYFASYISRSRSNKTKYIREVAQKPSDFSLNAISYVPLRSVIFSAPGTVNKLGGAYFNDGVVGALVNPSQKVTQVESILRA